MMVGTCTLDNSKLTYLGITKRGTTTILSVRKEIPRTQAGWFSAILVTKMTAAGRTKSGWKPSSFVATGKEFCRDTSMHGLPFLAEEGRHKCERYVIDRTST